MKDYLAEYYKYLLDVRSQMQTGDLLLFAGKAMVSRAIRKFTGDYSHVEMIIDFNDLGLGINRIFTIGARNKGIEIGAVSDLIKKYDGNVYLYRVDEKILTLDDKTLLIREALTTLGTPYGYSNIFNIAKDEFLKLVKIKKDDKLKDINPDDTPEQIEELICSEAVSYWMRKIGFDLCTSKPDEATYPTDTIIRCRKVVTVLERLEGGEE
jgi:hypothetical protein